MSQSLPITGYFDGVSPQEMVAQAIDDLDKIGTVGQVLMQVVYSYQNLTLDMELIAAEVVIQVERSVPVEINKMVAESIRELRECSNTYPKPGRVLTHILTKTMDDELDMTQITRAIFSQLQETSS